MEYVLTTRFPTIEFLVKILMHYSNFIVVIFKNKDAFFRIQIMGS